MKVLMYAVRPDEMDAIQRYTKEFGIEYDIVKENFGVENAHKAKGYDAVSILGNCLATREALKIVADLGVKVVADRSTGYEKIDLEAAKEYGLQVSNVPGYSPNAISEYAITSALMLARNVKIMMQHSAVNNYSLKGLIGFEIRKSVVGIIGTGRIGREAAKGFKGLGARVIAYDIYPCEEAKEYLEYVSLDELLRTSDVISLHMPLFDSNYHMINAETLKKMKRTAVLVNTSRGGLVDSKAMLEALENKQIAGYAMDVYEKELGIMHCDRSQCHIEDEVFNKLHALDNVIVSPHYAFYTDEAVANMVEIALKNISEFEKTGHVLNKLF